MKISWSPLMIALMISVLSAVGQNSVLGKWKSVDDKTGKTKSIVELYEVDGKIFGRVIKIFPGPNDDQDPICNQCPADDTRYKKKIIGMDIIRGLQQYGSAYAGGDILDPEIGKVYRCRIWLEVSELKVRGYWGPFWRTQTWLKAS